MARRAGSVADMADFIKAREGESESILTKIARFRDAFKRGLSACAYIAKYLQSSDRNVAERERSERLISPDIQANRAQWDTPTPP